MIYFKKKIKGFIWKMFFTGRKLDIYSQEKNPEKNTHDILRYISNDVFVHLMLTSIASQLIDYPKVKEYKQGVSTGILKENANYLLEQEYETYDN